MSDHESSTSAPEEKSPAKEENKDTEESANEEENEESTIKIPPKKSPKKIKKRSNSEDEENSAGETNGDENEDSDEDKPVGLLDRPVEIQSGHRERKKVDRLEMNFKTTSKEKKLDYQEGSGEKLGDIPRIELQLQKNKADDLKPVHRVLFNRPGTVFEIKRNIKRFSGFTFKKGSTEFERKETNIAKLNTSTLKQICEVLDLEKTGIKEDLIPRIMSFLMKPKTSEKPLPKSKKSKSPGTEKRTSDSKKTVKDSSKTKRRKTRDSDSGADSEKSEKEDSEEEEEKEEPDAEEEEEEEEEEKEEEEEEKEEEEKSNYDSDDEPKKKKSKTVSKTPKKKEKVKKPEKKAATKRKKESSGNESDSSDEEPLVKKVKVPPTDDELKDNIKKILDGANLEEVTMKSVCKQVYANYPDHDLTTRKDFIKATVKTIIS